MTGVFKTPDALPQLMGEFRPVDEWQAHINEIFYGLRGARVCEFYQTFAGADYRLSHALAADYYARAQKRDQAKGKGFASRSSLTIHEWGCGNGNLAACFLTHLKNLDTDRLIYPRVRYVLIDHRKAALETALGHSDLAPHLDRVEPLCANVESLSSVKEKTVDRIFCNELWNELPTKLMFRKDGEIEEELMRPNLHEARHAEISDWSAFLQAFEKKDLDALARLPSFLEDIIWEREYLKVEWKAIPYRKTVTEFLKTLDDQVFVPVNVGACSTVKEARRVLASDAIGFSSFDAGAAEAKTLNDPDTPCYGQFGGQYSFLVNFALLDAVARYEGFSSSVVEPQREFVGRSLNTNVISLMDLLAAHPRSHAMTAWERDRLILRTIEALNKTYGSPYCRKIDFPVSKDMPAEERQALVPVLQSLKLNGVPDTIAYLSEEELIAAQPDLQALGYEREIIETALRAPAQPVDYYHHFFRP